MATSIVCASCGGRGKVQRPNTFFSQVCQRCDGKGRTPVAEETVADPQPTRLGEPSMSQSKTFHTYDHHAVPQEINRLRAKAREMLNLANAMEYLLLQNQHLTSRVMKAKGVDSTAIPHELPSHPLVYEEDPCK